MKLYKLNNGELIEAPYYLHFFENGKEIFMTNPTDEKLKELGYKPLQEKEKPILNENQYLQPIYNEKEDYIEVEWEVMTNEVLLESENFDTIE